MTLLLGIVASVFLADFLSGLAHWVEDSYFTPDTPLLGSTIAKNVLHHHQPDAFTCNPWHLTIRSSVVCSVVVAAGLYVFGAFGPVWGAALGLAAFANQVHKWAHLRSSAIPRAVRWLQSIGVLQSPAHHAAHHGGAKDSRYCVITNALNPVLDALGFWRGLEAVVEHVVGARPRPELIPRVV
jgi:ubiquitin-conjugating enzyme E2 variant